MVDHYITAMTAISTHGLSIACRCGWFHPSGSPQEAQQAWRFHTRPFSERGDQ